ncbi:MAG TPA: Mth938-like domain-containing protein [Burkholderiales bacterium]|nr:Mth938-like domain-containing protein [Burkholderiales bacterium]
MKFHLTTAAGQHLFTGYGAGYVAVDGVRHEISLIVTPQQIYDDWRGLAFEQLTAAHFEFLLTLQPELVLLGTGNTLRFPPPALSRCLIESRVGLEVMDTTAACRTYNILTAEGRGVVAAVLLPSK